MSDLTERIINMALDVPCMLVMWWLGRLYERRVR
jgi:hypothetical protein